MLRVICVCAIFLATASGWCAKKVTVAQLEDQLRTMREEKKSDAEIGTALKQLELSEELTASVMNRLAGQGLGPLATEQIYVLEAESADLAPPSSDLPSTPTPDAAAQKAILDKAATYVLGTYAQLPHLTALKSTLRFQDNVEAVAAGSGLHSGATDVVVGSGFSNPAAFVHYINAAQTQITSVHGAEEPPAAKDKTPWGANKMIALQEPDPSLTAVFREAQNSGSLRWLRWESISGISSAVFGFDVPRKQSHLNLHICCFPNINQTGIANFYNSSTASLLAGPERDAGGGGGVTGNFQTRTEWHDYKTTAPYRGRIFVDPSTGIVIRMIVEAELKPAEVVHQVDIRTDYAPVRTAGKMYILPVKTYIDTLVVPNGDSGAASYTTRRTLFTSEFKGYEIGSN